jgi:hypothetical protein
MTENIWKEAVTRRHGTIPVHAWSDTKACVTLVYKSAEIPKRRGELRYSYPCNKPWRPIGLWDVEAPIFSLDNRLTDGDEVVSLTRRPPFTPRKIPGTHFCYRPSGLQGHSEAGRIRSIEKYNDPTGNRTGNLLACSIVPQLTTLPHAPRRGETEVNFTK